MDVPADVAAVGETSAALRDWFARQLPDARDVRIESFDRVALGHSADDHAHSRMVGG